MSSENGFPQQPAGADVHSFQRPVPVYGTLLRAILLLGCLLPGRLPAGVEHVIHVSVDGLPGRALELAMEANPQLYPNFQRFVDEGLSTFNARTDYLSTWTLPNHTSMITGRPVFSPTDDLEDVTYHGYTHNGDPAPEWTLHNRGNPNVPYIESVFDVVHDHGKSTALYATKSKFVIFDQSYDATSGSPDTLGDDNGRDKIDMFLAKSSGGPSYSLQMNLDYIADMTVSQYDYSFVHYRDLDSLGHGFGWGSVPWTAGLQTVDGYLGQLFDLVESNPELAGETAIIVTSDHGGWLFNHGRPYFASVFTIPQFVWGPGFAQGMDLYALNSQTRRNPRDNWLNYLDTPQPIRNGGTGNLALQLLGLPPIEGSMINANQDLAVFLTGDMDGDNDVDFDDIGPFVLALTEPVEYENQFGVSAEARGDFDRDGDHDFDDIGPFAAALTNASSQGIIQRVPEPACFILFGLGWAILARQVGRR